MSRLLLIAVLLCVGCAGALDRAVTAANVAQVFLTQAEHTVAELHRSERDAAIERATTEADARLAAAAVHAKFAPIWDAYRVARAAWIASAAVINAARVAEEANSLAVADAATDLASAMADFSRALDTLKCNHSKPPPVMQ